jgi:hypothetical protein
MKKERALRIRKCPTCGHSSPDPLTIFRLPQDAGLLAEALDLPEESVAEMIAQGAIRPRRAVDKNGRCYGPVIVLFADALKAMEGLRGET